MVIKYGFNAFPIRKAQFFAPRFDQSIPRTLALAANMKYHSQTLFSRARKLFDLKLGFGIALGLGLGFGFGLGFSFSYSFSLAGFPAAAAANVSVTKILPEGLAKSIQLPNYAKPRKYKWYRIGIRNGK